MRSLYFLSLIVLVYSQYELENSGYSQNDPAEVKKTAGASPKVQPKDYTANGKLMDEQDGKRTIGGAVTNLLWNLSNIPGRTLIGGSSGGNLYNTGTVKSEISPKTDIEAGQTNTVNRPSYDFLGLNLFKSKKTEQENQQGQASIQKGGDMTNIQTNENNIQVSQINNNNMSPLPSYDFLGILGNTVGSLFGKQNNNQGQSNVQQGGSQNNVAHNVNTVYTTQVNNNDAGGKQQPSYDVPGLGVITTIGDSLILQQLPLLDGPLIDLGFLSGIQLSNLINVAAGRNNKIANKSNQQQGAVNTHGTVDNNVAQGQYSDSVRPAPLPAHYQFVPQHVFENYLKQQNLGQTNSQGQSNAQIGGAQTNVGNNANSINIGQTNNNGGRNPQYDAYRPTNPGYGAIGTGYAGQFLPQNIFAGNKVDYTGLNQGNNQGQSSVQQGGAQTNVGNNANAINIGQTNQNARPAGGPQYDSKYGQPSYPQQPSYAQYLPQNIFAGNKVDYTGLGQTNNQGQSNTQVGGAQTNVGNNANAINIGQTNQNARPAGGPQYDSKYGQPSYPQQPSYAQYLPQNIFAGNKVDYTGLGQTNNQGQSNTQVGGAQTNVGNNANAINIGQTNQNARPAGGPQYDSKYAPSYPQKLTFPQQPSYGGAVAGDLIKNNLINAQNLGQTSSQGQSNTQVGGAQTNVGNNENAINIGQTNQNARPAGSPQYDSKYAPSYPQKLTFPQQPSYGGAVAGDLIKNNLINAQNLGQTSSQGQENVQVGGAQTNVGNNSNAINIGQTNDNSRGNKSPSYDAKIKKAPEPEPEQSYRRRA